MPTTKEVLPLEELIEDHIEQHATEATYAQAEQLTRNGTAAFREVNPETITNIPVAVAQEPAAFTRNTLSIFARQMKVRDIKPFNLSISANYPLVKRESYAENIHNNLRTLQEMRGRFNNLPFSYFTQAYEPDTTIGTIRGDVFKASLIAFSSLRKGKRVPEHTNLLITDIDTSYVSPRYIPSQQERMRQGYSFTCANKRYSLDPHYPELSRAVAACNLAHRLSPAACYDCHTMYNLRAVLAADGFSNEDSIFETHKMRARAKEAMGEDFKTPEWVAAPGAIAISPPRRLFDKFRAGKSKHELWEKDEFGMQDAYREGKTGDHDITRDMANFIIAECVAEIVSHDRNLLMRYHLDRDKTLGSAQAYRTVSRYLGRVLQVADVIFDFNLDDIHLMDAMRRPALG